MGDMSIVRRKEDMLENIVKDFMMLSLGGARILEILQRDEMTIENLKESFEGSQRQFDMVINHLMKRGFIAREDVSNKLRVTNRGRRILIQFKNPPHIEPTPSLTDSMRRIVESVQYMFGSNDKIRP